ncbi:MAG: hypothetical protein MI749_08140 [Desulfovibrionales bacterium]|nr:hypothetical protein [Desulfovibrionales bacterium]
MFVMYAGWYIDSSTFPHDVEEHLNDATGLAWEIRGGLNVSIFPLAISAKDVVVFHPEQHKRIVSIGNLSSGVDILALLSGKIVFSRIGVHQLDLVLSEDILGETRVDSEEMTSPTDVTFGDVAAQFDLAGIDVSESRIVWETESNKESGFVAVADLDVTVDVGSTTKFVLSCAVESDLIPTEGRLTATGESELDIHTLSVGSVLGQLTWSGEVELEGQIVPTRFDVQLSADIAKDILTLSEVNAEIADGTLAFSGRLSKFTTPDWKLNGQAVVQDLSLPYWFGFTENLPTSLNHALDRIDGVLSIEMTKEGVWSDNLRAEVLGMKLSGVGGCKDFSDPVVYIDARGEYIDVNKIFPEISQTPPDVLPKPVRSALPIFREDPNAPELTPEEKKEAALSELHVGYDIRIAAETATAYGFTIGQLAFRCWPAPKTGTYTSYTIDEAYGGTIDSLLTIRDDLRLEATVKNVQTEEIARILTGDSILSGIANGTVDVRAKARTVYGLVAGLNGTVNAVLADGFVKTLPTKQPDGSISSSTNYFQSMKISLTEKSLSPKPDEAGNDLEYDWDLLVDLVKKEDSSRYVTKLKGPIILSATRVLPVRGKNVDFDITWYRGKTKIEKMLPASWRLQSKLTYDLETEDLTIQGGRFSFDKQRFLVNLTGKHFLTAPEIRGSFEGEEFNLRPLLQSLQLLPWEPRDPNVFTKASLRGELDLREDRYALYNVVGYVDDSAIRGSVLVNTAGNIPTIRADASIGEIVLHNYFPPKNVDVRAKVFTKRAWELDWLRQFDIKGSLKVARITYDRIDIQKLVTPVSIGKGIISVGPLEATMYNGSVSGEFNGELKEKLESRIVANANGVDMALASKGAVGEDYLGGRATGYLETHGVLGSNHDLLANMNGIWGVAIKNGFFGFSKNDEGEIEKTTFTSAVSDGNIAQGILSSENFAVSSPFVDMRGGGQVDIVNKEIDYKVNVTYARIPTVPVAIMGHWDEPKVTVDGLTVVPRTIGKLGGGVFSILKDAFLIPFRAVDLLPSLR